MHAYIDTYIYIYMPRCTFSVWNDKIRCHFLSLCQNLTSCACISSSSEDAVALPGKCPSPGCQEAFLTFLCVICVCSMIGAMAQTPSVIILIRQIDLLLYIGFPKEGAIGTCSWGQQSLHWVILLPCLRGATLQVTEETWTQHHSTVKLVSYNITFGVILYLWLYNNKLKIYF